MRRQNAIYWPPSTPDDYGKQSFGSLVELTLADGVNSRVRWEDREEEFVDTTGTAAVSSSVVYCPVLPGGGEVEIGGFIWLGDRADLTDESVPRNNAGAAEIRMVEKLPNLKASEFLRTAYLQAR
jgi:hypothetical protein